jgi:hypothetical protein
MADACSRPAPDSSWRLASVSGGAHLKRVVAMYEEMGYETRLEEVTPADCGNCTVCFEEAGEKAYRVFTRRRG